ncbi:hypothetical protein N0V82_004004 [Gnomoniopsis sp. IMI 355080]|nr:hypothetical protein N0V82_004004 [Gnomoniopsis sp. IMI 355080]
MESLSEEHLIPLALARVDRFDGGLSRRRWEARREAETAASVHSRLHDTKNQEDTRRAPSPIYVNIHDPLGRPAFERSPTKPIPKWMQHLPSMRVEPDEPRPFSVLDRHFSPRGSNTAAPDHQTTPPPVPSHNSPPDAPPPVPPHKKQCKTIAPTYMPDQMSCPFTLIAEEPVQRPSSSRGSGAGGKHVRFGGISAAHAGPSASAEYLERYSVGRPGHVKSGLAVAVPTGPENRSLPAKVWTPPSSRRVGSPHRTLGDGSVASGTWEESAPSSMGMKVDHRTRGIGSGHRGEYSASVGSSVHSEEGVVGRRSRPLGMTFQDQLKKVFGFN